MTMSVLVLVMSGALFLFYIQTICKMALRQEFSRPYFREIVQAIHLEYPHLRDSFASSDSVDCAQTHLALKCDFMTLKYLMKNGDPARRHLSRSERLLVLYFRFLLFSLPIRHAFKLKEKEAVVQLATILEFFANSVGEKLSVTSFANAQAQVNS
jgi:hypothetical protein